MKTSSKSDNPVLWERQARTLTLQGEPVLKLELSWPRLTGQSRGAEKISRYYRKLALVWQSRWERAVYCLAGLELAQCRAEGRPFTPWQGKLSGEISFRDASALSVRMEAREIRGDGRPLVVVMGDIWSLPEGAPRTVKSFFPKKRRWRSQLLQTFRAQGEARRAAGDCFLDADFSSRLKKLLPSENCCRTGEGLEFYVPQCAIAPAAEGVVTFRYPLEDEKTAAQESR